MKYIALLLVSLAVIILLSCSAQPSGHPIALEQYDTVYIRVEFSAAHKEQDILFLQNSIITELVNLNLPWKIMAAPTNNAAGSGLSILVNVDTMRRVSDSLRISQGRSASSNTISANFVLIDNSNLKILPTFRLSAYSPQRTPISPDWPWGNIETAMQRISRLLARKLANWYNK